jgi:Domain of unknown function (DUF4340)
MNRTHLNLALAVVVAALGTAGWLAQRHQSAKAEKPRLTTLSPEAVTRVRIEWPGKPAIALEKKADGWWLTEPVATRADHFEAVGATSMVSNPVSETLDSTGLDLKEIGLDPPDHVVRFNDVAVAFGGVEPLQQRRYMRVNGQVSLIDDPAFATLDADYSDLVAKELFGKDETVQAIRLPAFTVTRGSNGEWTAPPGTAHATPAALKALAESWEGARALYNEAAPGEAPKGDAVQITLKDGTTRAFVVAATEPQLALYAPALHIRYVLSKALVDTLLKLPAPKAEAAQAPSDTLPTPAAKP